MRHLEAGSRGTGGGTLLCTAWLAGAFFCSIGLAQQGEPSAAPAIDLEVLAKALDPGEVPDVRAAIPERILRWVGAIAGRTSPEDMSAALQWGDSPTAQTAAAVSVLGRPAAARDTASELYEEILALWILADLGEVGGKLRRAFAGDPVREGDWVAANAEAWQRRGHGLAAQLLRRWPDAPEVGHYLMLARRDLPGVTPAVASAEGLRRLGTHASAVDRLAVVHERLAKLDFAGAEQSLAEAEAVPMPTNGLARRATARALFDERHRLARARMDLVGAPTEGLDARIARLRAMAQADPDTAFRVCREMVEQGVDHSLPHTLLGFERISEGDFDAARARFAEAAKLPGIGMLQAFGVMTTASCEGMLHPPRDAAAVTAMRAKFGALLVDMDSALAKDPAPESKLWRWLRSELHYGEDQGDFRPQLLPQAIDLIAELPDWPQPYVLALAMALRFDDHAAALAFVRRPVPKALAGLPYIMSTRATAYVWLDLLADAPPVAADLDAVLGDLERVQGNDRESHFLRGVRAWWESTRPGASADLQKQALEHFRAAQRPFGESGAWQSACALAVAEARSGGRVDLPALFARRWDEEGTDSPARSLAAATLIPQQAQGDDEGMRAVSQLLKGLDREDAKAFLHAAVAAELARAGDDAGAGHSARDALHAADAERMEFPLHRGVTGLAELRVNVGATSRATLDIGLTLDLCVLPPLPDRAELQRMIDKAK